MAAISGRTAVVKVEYTDAKGNRVTKVFPNAYSARSFYVVKDKAGANPVVHKAT